MAQTAKFDDTALTDTILNERTFGWDTAFPSTYPANGWFIRTDTNVLYQNTGTEGTPTWTQRGGLTAHEHSGAGDGGKLDGDVTTVTYNSVDYSLIQLAAI